MANDNKSNPFKTPGWHSPVLHPAAEGDAFDAPPPEVPGGPPPDPIGNLPGMSKGTRELPLK